MNKLIYKIILVGLILAILSGFFIYFWAGDIVNFAFSKKPPYFLKTIIDFLYPRFWVEKYRFSPLFFEAKVQQLALRLCIVGFFLGAFVFLRQSSANFREKLTNFWSIKTNLLNVRILQVFLAIIIFYCSWDWLIILGNLYEWKSFYQPVFLLKILGLPFPEFHWLGLGYFCLMLGLISLIFNYLSNISIWFILGIFVLFQGYIMSFHKIDHTYATVTDALLGMPFLIQEAKKASKRGEIFCEAWALRLIQLMIAIAYFLAGLEKILIGGFEWFSPLTLQTYLQMHHTYGGLWLAQFPILCSLLAILAVGFELFFPLGIIFPKLLVFILLGGIAFHLSTYFLLNAGGLVSPWWLLYVFYVDWSKVFRQNAPSLD